MIVRETRGTRRLLVRLASGEELLRSLEAVLREENVSAAWVRGVGTLSSVELDRLDSSRRDPERQRIDRTCELLALEGTVSDHGEGDPSSLYATLARPAPGGVEVIGGRLRSADVLHAELVLDCFDVVDEARRGEPASSRRAPQPGAQAWTGAALASSDEEDEDDGEDEGASAGSSGGVSWADVAALSAAPKAAARPASGRSRAAEPPGRDFRPPPIPERRKTTEEELMQEVLPEKGDYIQHRQFGLCRIDREDGEGGIQIRLPSGVKKTIKLDFMDVSEPRMERGKRIFAIRPRRR